MIEDNVYKEAIRRVRLDRHPDMKMSVKQFYLYLVDLADERGHIHMTTRELNSATGISIGAISEAIEVLRERGYIQAGLSERERGYQIWFITVPEVAREAGAGAEQGNRRTFHAQGVQITVSVEKEPHPYPAKERQGETQRES